MLVLVDRISLVNKRLDQHLEESRRISMDKSIPIDPNLSIDFEHVYHYPTMSEEQTMSENCSREILELTRAFSLFANVNPK